MTELISYIVDHTERGECQCGSCCDKGPERKAPDHSVNVHFFWVSAKGSPTAAELVVLLGRHYPNLTRLVDGPSYIEMGAELGDQQIALRLIGLGELVGLWKAITPETIGITGPTAAEMAGLGLVNCSGLKPAAVAGGACQ